VIALFTKRGWLVWELLAWLLVLVTCAGDRRIGGAT
jgi:hypothetical protein